LDAEHTVLRGLREQLLGLLDRELIRNDVVGTFAASPSALEVRP